MHRHSYKTMIGERLKLHCTVGKDAHYAKKSHWKCDCQTVLKPHPFNNKLWILHTSQANTISRWMRRRNQLLTNLHSRSKDDRTFLCPITSSPAWGYACNTRFHIDRGLYFLTAVQHKKLLMVSHTLCIQSGRAEKSWNRVEDKWIPSLNWRQQRQLHNAKRPVYRTLFQ